MDAVDSISKSTEMQVSRDGRAGLLQWLALIIPSLIALAEFSYIVIDKSKDRQREAILAKVQEVKLIATEFRETMGDYLSTGRQAFADAVQGRNAQGTKTPANLHWRKLWGSLDTNLDGWNRTCGPSCHEAMVDFRCANSEFYAVYELFEDSEPTQRKSNLERNLPRVLRDCGANAYGEFRSKANFDLVSDLNDFQPEQKKHFEVLGDNLWSVLYVKGKSAMERVTEYNERPVEQL